MENIVIIQLIYIMIIGICGKKRHGKDTIADYLKNTYGFVQLSFAQPLKDACKILFKLSDEQLYGDLKEVIDPRHGKSPREMLQWLGTDVFRNQFNDSFWINHLKMTCMEIIKQDPKAKIIVSDIRFQNELDIVKELNGFVIKINRPSIVSNDNHESEKHIDNIVGHNILIENDGTIDDLYNKVDMLFQNLN